MNFSENVIYQKCIDACSACAVACLRGINRIKNDTVLSEKESLIQLLSACGEACILNLKALANESNYLQENCNKCEDLCARTTKECERFEDLGYLKTVAIASGNCAMECKVISEI